MLSGVSTSPNHSVAMIAVVGGTRNSSEDVAAMLSRLINIMKIT